MAGNCLCRIFSYIVPLLTFSLIIWVTILNWDQLYYKVAVWLTGYSMIWLIIILLIWLSSCLESCFLNNYLEIFIKMIYLNAVFFLPGLQAIWTVVGFLFIFVRWHHVFIHTPPEFLILIFFCLIFQIGLYVVALVVLIVLAIEKIKELAANRRLAETDPNQAIMLSDPLFNPYKSQKSRKFKKFLRENILTLVKRPFTDIDKFSLKDKFTSQLTDHGLEKLNEMTDEAICIICYENFIVSEHITI